ncbi:MAG: TetR/AcrR family transcriptional regulator [Candidatus Cloacimonetes bacterium]|nr:TetR/AcrR family transcriptional regulator [Candidatus Cloacimonadota bacterium]
MKNFSERQRQIVTTAIGIIAKQGIQNLTTKNLAQAIGISEAALYRHFDSKLEIMQGVLEYFKILMQPALAKLKSHAKPTENLEEFVLEHFRIFTANSSFARVIFSESNFQNEEILMNSLNKMMINSRQALEDVIIQAQRKGEFRTDISSCNISRMMIGSIRFIVSQWSVSGMAFNLENEGRQLCKDIIAALKLRQ